MPIDQPHPMALLRLLQLASPALPVGAYSYSEGLEALVEAGRIADVMSLHHWLGQELQYGAIRVEAGVMVRCYRAIQTDDWGTLERWNHWLSAARETEELRLQSWQMGRSLLRLLQDLNPEQPHDLGSLREECNFAPAYALAAHHWHLDLQTALLGYLYSWASNLVSAGVRLIPLGQTAGQQLLLTLHPQLEQATLEIPNLEDDALQTSGWGLALASIAHETQYSRLFRS